MNRLHLVAVFCLAFCDSLLADVVFSIGTTSVTAGSRAMVGVFAASTESTGEQFGSFNAAIDMQPSGVQLASGISPSMPLLTNILFPNTQNFGVFGGQDFSIGGDFDGGFGILTTTPTKLFDINVDIGAGTTPGSYDLTFSNLLTEIAAQDGTVLPIASLNKGAIVVLAVPEPNGFLMILAAMLCGPGLQMARRYHTRLSQS